MHSQPPGIWLILKGQVLSNNSLVTLEDVGEVEESLQCWTDRQDCCHSDYTAGGAFGKWYSPDGSKVNFAVNYELSYMTRPLYRNRGHQTVLLHRKKGGEDGVYYCEIPDEQGDMHRVYVGMYSATGGTGAGFLSLSLVWQLFSKIQLGFLSLVPILSYRNRHMYRNSY